ncbi:TetR/AcrR family transcriptional regulator [Streptomyces cellulosae]
MQAHDPRARPSRTRLRTAILELAATEEIGAITMSEIARQAGVNRATVYQHFPDVNALVTNAMADAVAHVARAAALCPLDAPRDETPHPCTRCSGTSRTAGRCTGACWATRGARCSPRACGSG